MNHTSIVACVAMLSLAASLFAEEQLKPKARKGREITPAERAVWDQILKRFPDPSPKRDLADKFSRAIILFTPLYTYAMVDHAPEGITRTATRFPFEIYDRPAYEKVPPPILLWGYYDAETKTLQVYVAPQYNYVVAAEHPFLKEHPFPKGQLDPEDFPFLRNGRP